MIVLFSAIFALVFFGGYIFISNIINPQSDITRLREENTTLRNKYEEISAQFENINSEIQKINSKDEELRLSVNLEPLSEEEKNYGIGGGSSVASFNDVSVSDINNIVANADYKLNELKSKLLVVKNNYEEIEKSLYDNVELQKSIPAILPSAGPIGDRFGMRLHPILKIRRMHPGVDIVVNTGTEVYAPGNGVVQKVGRRGGYGLTIEIDHGFGYTSLYAHLSKINVKKGQKVERGDLIGLSGKSGTLATGPHLHYEVKHNGVLLNPRNFIFSDMKAFDILTTKGSN